MRNTEQWTKREMTLVKDPLMALAAAVLQQWHEDGEPEGYAEGVAAWQGVFWTAYECHA